MMQKWVGQGHKFANQFRHGTCCRIVDQEMGAICGAPFVGPPSRKYCDLHSQTVKYKGKFNYRLEEVGDQGEIHTGRAEGN